MSLEVESMTLHSPWQRLLTSTKMPMSTHPWKKLANSPLMVVHVRCKDTRAHPTLARTYT